MPAIAPPTMPPEPFGLEIELQAVVVLESPPLVVEDLPPLLELVDLPPLLALELSLPLVGEPPEESADARLWRVCGLCGMEQEMTPFLGDRNPDGKGEVIEMDPGKSMDHGFTGPNLKV